LNEHAKENTADRADSDSDDDLEEHQRKKLRTESPAEQTRYEKPEKESSPTGNCDASNDNIDTHVESAIVCYSCGKKGSVPCSIFPIHCKPSYEQMRAGVPFYPTVLLESQAPRSTVLYDSITFLCMNCLPRYKTEWHSMQQKFMEKDPTKTALPRIPVPELVSCFTCGDSVSTKFNDGIVHTTTPSGKKNKNYEKLSTLKPPDGAVSLSFGFTYLCARCRIRFFVEKSNANEKLIKNDRDAVS